MRPAAGPMCERGKTSRMLSTETWPQPAVRIWTVAQRFQKFLVVGAVGLGVNQGMLVVLHDLIGLGLLIASPVAIAASMIVTFMLNEIWTWHDRGSGRIATRALPYALINTGGLIINTGLLTALVDIVGMHYFVANLIGAGVAAVWNFALNNAITWRA